MIYDTCLILFKKYRSCSTSEQQLGFLAVSFIQLALRRWTSALYLQVATKSVVDRYSSDQRAPSTSHPALYLSDLLENQNVRHWFNSRNRTSLRNCLIVRRMDGDCLQNYTEPGIQGQISIHSRYCNPVKVSETPWNHFNSWWPVKVDL